MLRLIAVLTLLSCCSTATGSKAANVVVDLCSLEKRSSLEEVRFIAFAETNGLHGLFLSSEKCRFKFRVGKTPEESDKSVEQFIYYVNSGGDLTWRKYKGEFSGRVVMEDAKVRFEILHVYWFRNELSGP